MAAAEATWETEHADGDVKNTYSATKAIEIAYAEAKYPERITTEPGLETAEVKPKSTKPKKEVSFIPSTKFDTGRAKLFWDRGSSHYEPGSNACPSPEGWFNSSKYTVPRFNASQLKLYVIKSLEQYRSIQNNLRILATLKHEGQVSLHWLWDEIQGENEGRMATMERKQGDSFYSSSNTIVVLETATCRVSKRMFVTVPSPDNAGKDSRDESWKSYNGTTWTSLKDMQG